MDEEKVKRAEMRTLLTRASEEIEGLREQCMRLEQYRAHTERMLALFEGGPRAPQHSGEGEDVAWMLRRMAHTYQEVDSESQSPR